MRQAVISFLKDKNSRLLLIAGATAVVLGVGIFGGLQLYDSAVEQDRVESEIKDNAGGDAIACDVYFANDGSTITDEATRAGLEQHHRYVQVLTVLGGTPEWLYLLEDIDRGYVSFFDGDGADEIATALAAIDRFCAVFEE